MDAGSWQENPWVRNEEKFIPHGNSSRQQISINLTYTPSPEFPESNKKVDHMITSTRRGNSKLREFESFKTGTKQRAIASRVAQRLKRLPLMQETRVPHLGREDPLEREMATHWSILAWRIPWTEEATIHRVAKSQTRLSNFTSLQTCYHFSFEEWLYYIIEFSMVDYWRS